MTAEKIKAAFPGLELTDDEWAELASLTSHEDRDFPTAMGQVRFGLLCMAVGALQAVLVEMKLSDDPHIRRVSLETIRSAEVKNEAALGPERR